MITLTKVEKFRNSIFIGLQNDGVTIAEKYDLVTLKLNDGVSKIKTNILKLNEVYALARKNGNTEVIEELDEKRDKALIGIKGLTEAFLNHFNILKVNAAKNILIAYEKYGKRIDKLSYLAETEAVRSFVNDFDTDTTLKANATLLDITDWILELKTANEDFNSVYLNRNKELAEQPDQNLKNLRKPAFDDFNSFYNLVSAYNTINPNTDYAKLLSELNELLLKYNATVPKSKPKTEVVVPPQK